MQLSGLLQGKAKGQLLWTVQPIFWEWEAKVTRRFSLVSVWHSQFPSELVRRGLMNPLWPFFQLCLCNRHLDALVVWWAQFNLQRSQRRVMGFSHQLRTWAEEPAAWHTLHLQSFLMGLLWFSELNELSELWMRPSCYIPIWVCRSSLESASIYS